jgi:hypothetical protein
MSSPLHREDSRLQSPLKLHPKPLHRIRSGQQQKSISNGATVLSGRFDGRCETTARSILKQNNVRVLSQRVALQVLTFLRYCWTHTAPESSHFWSVIRDCGLAESGLCSSFAICLSGSYSAGPSLSYDFQSNPR